MAKIKSYKKMGFGKFLVMALVLGGGLIYGTQMVQNNQENRSNAAKGGGGGNTSVVGSRCVPNDSRYPTSCMDAKTILSCNPNTRKWALTLCDANKDCNMGVCMEICTAAEAYPNMQPTCVEANRSKTCSNFNGRYYWTYSVCSSGSFCVDGWCK